MNRVLKCFSLLLVSAFMMFILTSNKVSANYDNSKNYVTIGVGNYKDADDEGKTKLSLEFAVTYQRGFSKEDAEYMVCKMVDGDQVLLPENCQPENVMITWRDFVDSGTESDYIVRGPATTVDNNTTTKRFQVKTDIEIDYSNKENSYIVFAQSYFCAVRKGATEDGFTGCEYWHDSTHDENKQFTKREFKLGDALNANVSDIEDEQVATLMQQISDIVTTVVMPIIYAVLGLFLVVKGALLGVQIVKAADEPQIRQEKIGALKWLVIGVAVAFLASGAVHVVMSFFSSEFSYK